MRKYQAAELTACQALAMAEASAQAHGCPVVWIAWLRSPQWGEFAKSDTLHDWTGNRQTVLLFPAERATRLFIRNNQIGGDWQTQPYPLATITDTCAQHGTAWREVQAGEPWVVPLVDLVCPYTGAIVQVEHAVRLSTRIRPPAVAKARYDPARVRWRMGKAADRIAQAIAEIE
jgi:hypothetical protein